MLTLLAGATPALGADDPRVENLALCRDSWLDWKTTDPAKLDNFVDYFHSAFAPHANDPFAVPKLAMTIDGLKVKQVFPQSVGMGVGFSVMVDAAFDVARRAVEQELGKPLAQCESGEGMRTCELPIAEQRTVMLLSGDPPNDRTTLIGCFYVYEK